MIPAFVLLLLVIVMRVAVPFVAGTDSASLLWNFSPIAALALCGAFAMPKRWAIAFPLLALFFSDLALNAYYGAELLGGWLWVRYAALALLTFVGFQIHRRFDLRQAAFALLPASLAGSVFFYLVTNTASWIAQPAYAKTLAGWVQSLTVGLPGFAPTWMFFRSSLLSDLLFTGVFVACVLWGSRAQLRTPVQVASASQA